MNSLTAVCYAHGRPTRSAECYALINGATHLLRKFRLTAQQLRFGQVVVTFALLPLTRRCKLTTADNLWKKQFTGLFFLISSCCGGNLLPFKWGVRNEQKLSISECAINSADELVGNFWVVIKKGGN